MTDGKPPAAVDPFAAVELAFGSLGRACLALDGDLKVLHASPLLDSLGGAGTCAAVKGKPIEELLGSEMFGADGPLRTALLGGQKREGWRAVLDAGGARRLMSVSACPLLPDIKGACHPDATYLVVLRPDEDAQETNAPIAGFGLIGRSQAMTRVFRLIESLQDSEATVLVTGESGTGKEVLARIIHENSPRRSGPFVAVNPAALPPDLIESELFGHVRGSFTGAVRDRVGRFESANDGTLFLDELGELPLHLQVKLLRVLQERTFERVGEGTMRRTNARIIAATNRNLRREVAEGRFREDLYYRLRVVPIEVPPLRARREDIEPIARLLLGRICDRTGRAVRLSPDAVRVLLSYDWPGNVRELENALEFAVTVSRGQTVQPEDFPPEVVSKTPMPAPAPAANEVGPPAPVAPLALTREALARALQEHGWKRDETAKALGISRSTLWRRMRAVGLD